MDFDDLQLKDGSRISYNEASAQQLWRISEDLTK
jgi:hypothetical protein